MGVRRVGILLGKEFVRGPRNFLFIFAIVVPVVATLVLSLVFGSLFSGKPRLGIVDQGDSQLTAMAAELGSLDVQQLPTEGALRSAVSDGSLDMGLVLPADFDAAVTRRETIELAGYVWGESLLSDRAVLGTSVAVLLRQLAGQEPPVDIVSTSLGDGESISLEDRLLPFFVLMTVLMSGVMVPAASLVTEKQKRTLRALITTPTSLREVFLAKGLLGVILGLATGILILILNGAFGTRPLLLVGVLALGATMASTFGVLLGAFTKDINTLFATIKGIGIFLYAPALVYMFPELPQWIGRIFPTYYIVAPVIEISQKGVALADIVPELAVLLALILVLLVAASVVAGRVETERPLPRLGFLGRG